MVRCLLFLWCIAIVATAPVRAQSRPAEALRNAIGGCLAPTPERQLVSPAFYVPIDEQVVEGSESGARARAKLLDRIVLRDRTISISQAYASALSNRETALVTPTAEQLAARRRAERQLLYRRTLWDKLWRLNRDRQYSRRFELYRQLAHEYATAQDAAASGSEQAKTAMAQALDAWNVRGHRAEIESQLEAIRSADEAWPGPRWQRRDTAFGKASAGGRTPETTANPVPVDWLGDGNWVTCPAVSVDGVTAALDLKFVGLSRDWFDDELPQDQTWRFAASTPGGADYPLSTGSGSVSGGRLPFVPDGMVLIRNVALKDGDSQATTRGTLLGGWLVRPLPASPNPLAGLDWGLDPPAPKPRVRVAGLIAGLGLDSDTFSGSRALGRHLLGPNVFVNVPSLDWLLVGTGAGPHAGGVGVLVAARLGRWLGEDVPWVVGVRVWSHDVQGMVGYSVPLWRAHPDGRGAR